MSAACWSGWGTTFDGLPEPFCFACRSVSRTEFLERLHELDAPLQARFAAACEDGRGLRYLAKLDRDGRASVRLVCPEPTHAALHGQLTDNLIQFRTRRYAANPLVVQGPGAGRDVTAAGVFGDILTIAQTQVPGDVIEVELESKRGVLIYEIKVLTQSGRVREVKIDARDGKVLKIEDD